MPELPEVETVRLILKDWVVNKTIKDIRILYNKLVDNVKPAEFVSALKGQTFRDVKRYGKYLVFVLDNNVVVSHLRMEGKYYYGHYKGSSFKEGYEYDPKTAPKDHNLKHVHLIFEFTDGSILMYHDVRKFGRMELSTELKCHSDTPLATLGIDPFLCSATYLKSQFQSHHFLLKQALLDQSIMCGIGNIYADEICYRSELSPFLEVSTLTNDQCTRLVEETKKVLKESIKLGGSTVRSYHASNGIDGSFQNRLKVYGREKELCERCGTPIVKTFLKQRGTHFCPQCQAKPLPSKVRVIGVTGLIGSGKSSVSQVFADNGYKIIDADQLTRDALKPGNACYRDVVKVFSKQILNPDKTINREQLRKLVMNDRKLIIKLEEIEHPYVIRETRKIIKASPRTKFLLDVPLLYEAGMDKLCDLVVFVNTEQKTRKARLVERDTMPLNEANRLNERVIEASEKIYRSDYVIDNSDTKTNTERQVRHLLDLLKAQD